MLEAVDLAAKLSREEYQAAMNGPNGLLNALRRQDQRCIVGKVPVAVVFEGWDAAGKGTMVSRIVERLDPRWFVVIPVSAPLEEERLRPFLWRFWMSLPRYGHWGIYDRSWYGRVLVERVDKLISPQEVQDALNEIVEFERQLTADGMVICKFFLHISKKEQRKRFRACEKDPYLAWKVQPEDWRHHKQYEIYVEAIEEMLAHTSRAHAPWTIVESTCARWAQVKVFRTICETVDAVLDRRGIADPELPEQEDPDEATPPVAAPEAEAQAAAEPAAAGGDQ